jgi:putative SOS response-associated peptidase YedK
MCGRFALANIGQVELRFGVEASDNATEHLQSRYNVAPSQTIPTIVEHASHRSLEWMRWGFAPAWMTAHKGAPPINARSETLLERPLFRGAVTASRCLIPADGFYEWQVRGKTKQPMYIRLKDGSVFAFAGIHAKAADGIETCAIITVASNELMEPIHNRMPAILEHGAEEAWLDPELTDSQAVISLLQSYPAEEMIAYPVNSRVGSPRNDDPALIEAI